MNGKNGLRFMNGVFDGDGCFVLLMMLWADVNKYIYMKYIFSWLQCDHKISYGKSVVNNLLTAFSFRNKYYNIIALMWYNAKYIFTFFSSFYIDAFKLVRVHTVNYGQYITFEYLFLEIEIPLNCIEICNNKFTYSCAWNFHFYAVDLLQPHIISHCLKVQDLGYISNSLMLSRSNLVSS